MMLLCDHPPDLVGFNECDGTEPGAIKLCRPLSLLNATSLSPLSCLSLLFQLIFSTSFISGADSDSLIQLASNASSTQPLQPFYLCKYNHDQGEWAHNPKVPNGGTCVLTGHLFSLENQLMQQFASCGLLNMW